MPDSFFIYSNSLHRHTHAIKVLRKPPSGSCILLMTWRSFCEKSLTTAYTGGVSRAGEAGSQTYEENYNGPVEVGGHGPTRGDYADECIPEL